MPKIFLLFFPVVLLLSRAGFADPGLDVMATHTASDEDPGKAGLQSGRYQVKQVPPDDNSAKRTVRHKKKKSPASDSPSVALPVQPPQTTTISKTPAPEVPSLKDQVKDMLTGGSNHVAEVYLDQVHPDDVRNNRVEIDAITGMIYDGSTATNGYRNYYSSAPLFKLGVHLWLGPSVGLSASYQATNGESIPSSSPGGTRVAVKSEWDELRLDFRKFYGLSRRANSLQWGVIMNEYKLDVSPSESSRVGLKSDAAGLYLEARIPTAPSYAWVFGGEFYPYDNVSELQTALNYSSGGSATANKFGLHLGGEIKMSRQSQILWTIGATMENSQYSGSPSLPDPVTGQTVGGISVINTWTYFNLGYRWGQ